MSKTKAPHPVNKKGIKQWQVITAVIVIIAIAGVIFLYPILFKKEVAQNEYIFKKEGELTFYDSTGTGLKKIDIEIADNEYERELGLMFRTQMTDNQGMLFIFPYASIQSFWMRNTKLSLDMIFVDDQKKIVTIHKSTEILSDQSYPSSEPAEYVVEVLAGFTDRYNVKVGDRIGWMDMQIKQ